MTLDEAIEHAAEVAQNAYQEYLDHRQLQCLLNELSYRKVGIPLKTMVEANIDELIKSCKAKAACDCTQCGTQHKQIAKWLTELKKLRKKQSS